MVATLGTADQVTTFRTIARLAFVSLLLAALVVQVVGIFRRDIHWDEFLFLTNVYRSLSGEHIGILQTSHVHLFSWLTRLGVNEIDQIIVARVIYLGLWAASMGLLYVIGSRLIDPLGAFAGVVLFGLFPFSIIHAVSFRVDGLILPLLLGVALFLLEPTLPRIAAAGILSGIAAALSIKAVLWAPAFVGLLAVSTIEKRAIAGAALAGIVVGLATLVTVLLIHGGVLVSAGAPNLAVSSAEINSIIYRMFIEEGFFPNFPAFLKALGETPTTWLLIALGLGVALKELRAPERRGRSLRLIVLASPLAFIAIYAGAWPYAYVVLMPTACLLAGLAVSFLGQSTNRIRSLIALICVGAAAVPAAAFLWDYRQDGQRLQRQVLSIVHDTFPDPVPYIDKTGMVSSFPHQGLFLTGLGIKGYRDAGVPLLSRFIESVRPPLLIVNTPVLDVWPGGDAERVEERFRLLPADEAAIRATYAPFWGPIYLAGREWRNVGAGERRLFKIVLAGAYTLLASGDVAIDGVMRQPGSTISLDTGDHELVSAEAEEHIRLLWGDGLDIPAAAPGALSIYFE